MKNKENKKKRFKLFDMNRDGKGVYEEESRKPTLKFFFVLTFRKFSQLIQLNLLMLMQVLPLIGVVAVFAFGASTYNVTTPTYAPLYGIAKIVDSPALLTRLDIMANQYKAPLITPVMIVIIAVLALFLFITFGWQNAGAAYVLRGLFRGDPVFVFSDFFYGIKKNLKQSLFLGMLDFACCFFLIFDIYYFYTSGNAIFLGILVAITIVYLFMRFYLYQLIITFDIKLIKALKNAVIFTMLGIWRNLVAGLGILILVVLHGVLAIMALTYGISIPLVLPFFYMLSLIGFISVYAAYPVIEKYMITPYEDEKDTVADNDDTMEDNPNVTDSSENNLSSND